VKRSDYLGIGFITLAVAYLLAYLMVTTTSAEDLFECKNIVAAVEAKHQIPPSVSTPGRPGILCDKGVRFPFLNSYDTVMVYGVINRDEQDALIATLQDYRHRRHTRKVLLRFFEKENWRSWSSRSTGRSGGERGPETTIREAWIN
jgi:hypothetical protein